MIITRIGPMSVARISGVIYAIIGFIVGCFFSMAAAMGVVAPDDGDGTGMMVFGAAAVFFLPFFYGFFGFVMSLITAGIYNALARMIGGIEVELREGERLSRDHEGH